MTSQFGKVVELGNGYNGIIVNTSEVVGWGPAGFFNVMVYRPGEKPAFRSTGPIACKGSAVHSAKQIALKDWKFRSRKKLVPSKA